MSGNKQKCEWPLTEMWRRFDFKMCGVVSFQSQFGNMFLVNGKTFFIYLIYLADF